LSFRLFDADYELTFDEFCERMGFANVGLIHIDKSHLFRSAEFNSHVFWKKITFEDHFAAETSKPREIIIWCSGIFIG